MTTSTDTTAASGAASKEWPELRNSLANFMLGWASRRPEDQTLGGACRALDAVTEPGLPLAVLRAAQAAPAAQEAEPALGDPEVDELARIAFETATAYGVGFEDFRHLAREIRRRCAAPRPQADAGAVAVPEGWRLVPVEPTAKMSKAAADAWLDCGSRLCLNKATAAARAAITAAPQAPAAPTLNVSEER